MRLRILIVSWKIPRSDFNAGDRRLVALLGAMARTHRVDYAVPAHVPSDNDAGLDELSRAGVNVVALDWGAFTTALARRLYNVVIFEFFHVFESFGQVVRERQPDAALLIDSVDVHFAREAGGEALGIAGAGKGAADIRARELTAYRAADAVIVVTEEDAKLLRSEAIQRLFLIPIIVPLRPRTKAVRPPELLFVGGFGHAPNVDAVRWFITEIFPLIRASVADAVITVVGSNPPAEIAALAATPGVQLLGYVPDTGPFLDRASISVAPLRYGAGMKGKVTEALAAGLPVVTTSCGAQGFGARSGVQLLIADDAHAFAESVVRLLNDPAEADTISAAGQSLAAAYSPSRVASAIEDMLAQMRPKGSTFGARGRWILATIHAFASSALRSLGPHPRNARSQP